MKRVAALASMPKEKKDPSFRKFIQRLVARKPKNLDAQFFQAHQEVFAKTDCLTCGNCCRTTSAYYRRPAPANNNIVYELEIGKPLLGDLCNTDQTPSELQVAERG